MPDRVIQVAIASLLSQFAQFAGQAGEAVAGSVSSDFLKDYLPANLHAQVLPLVANAAADASLIRQAERWVTPEPAAKGSRGASGSAHLRAILSESVLKLPAPSGSWVHPLTPLQVEDKATYPRRDEHPAADYDDLWRGLQAELVNWRQTEGPQWNALDAAAYFVTLLALLRKYLWCVPSAGAADVSRYDQARLTSAIAACLAAASDPQTEEVLLARGDLSGIQNFIYRIQRPDAETEHIGQRLRGRSTEIALLMEATADWLLRQFGLPPSCILFNGGGRFDLLLPAHQTEAFTDAMAQMNTWLLAQYGGELSIQSAVVRVRAADLADMQPVYRRLQTGLEAAKQHKWVEHLNEVDFYQPQVNLWHVCKVCQLTPLPESAICPDCAQQARLGKHLPHAVRLAYDYKGSAAGLASERIITFGDSPLGVRIGLVRAEDDCADLARRGWTRFERLNVSDDFIVPGAASSFRFLGNAAPRALTRLSHPTAGPVEAGEVLHFEALAALSQGAARLGVLKADVDRLGMVMSEGLNVPDQGLKPTIGRLAALSSMLDLFFSGHLNRICRKVFSEWQATTKHKKKDQVDGLFYVVYSGGDDLFVVGPWDQTLKLALRLQQEFTDFAAGNPNITISAGYVQVKPRFPVQQFATLVDEAEKAAKNIGPDARLSGNTPKKEGRNCLSAFDTVLEWDQAQETWDFAGSMQADIDSDRLPRGLLADLGQMERQRRVDKQQLMWTPRLYYALARRLSDEMFATTGHQLIKAMSNDTMLVLVSTVSLMTRKE